MADNFLDGGHTAGGAGGSVYVIEQFWRSRRGGGSVAQKFNTTYATLGFSDKASLDEGAMWPVAFALKELTAAEEVKIGALVKKAAS